MKRLLQWLRAKFSSQYEPSEFDRLHYEGFEQALTETDVEAYVYEERGIQGRVIVLKGEDLHQVTMQNLVSYRRLNRYERRRLNRYERGLLDKQGADLVRAQQNIVSKQIKRARALGPPT